MQFEIIGVLERNKKGQWNRKKVKSMKKERDNYIIKYVPNEDVRVD